MGKTYYCDYCDRFFKDEVEARKKHLSSMQHVANRESHYSIYKGKDQTTFFLFNLSVALSFDVWRYPNVINLSF